MTQSTKDSLRHTIEICQAALDGKPIEATTGFSLKENDWQLESADNVANTASLNGYRIKPPDIFRALNQDDIRKVAFSTVIEFPNRPADRATTMCAAVQFKHDKTRIRYLVLAFTDTRCCLVPIESDVPPSQEAGWHSYDELKADYHWSIDGAVTWEKCHVCEKAVETVEFKQKSVSNIPPGPKPKEPTVGDTWKYADNYRAQWDGEYWHHILAVEPHSDMAMTGNELSAATPALIIECEVDLYHPLGICPITGHDLQRKQITLRLQQGPITFTISQLYAMGAVWRPRSDTIDRRGWRTFQSPKVKSA